MSMALYYCSIYIILISLHSSWSSTPANGIHRKFWEKFKNQSEESLSRQSRMAANSTRPHHTKRQVWPKLSPNLSIGLNLKSKGENSNHTVKRQDHIRQKDKSIFLGSLSAYRITTAAMALTVNLPSLDEFALHNPKRAAFYHDYYRWILRSFMTIKNIPTARNFADALQPWQFRFKYPFDLIPPNLRKLFFWINDEEWKKEDLYMRYFKRWAVRAYGKSMDFWRNTYTYDKIYNGWMHPYDVRESQVSRELRYFDPEI